MKNIFDGDNNCEKFNIVNEQLSSYAWKILEVVSLVKGVMLHLMVVLLEL